MLLEDSSKIKERLNGNSLDSLGTSYCCLEKWKSTYGIGEPLITRGTSDVPVSIVKPWTRRIPGLVEGYKDVWNG